MTAVHTHYSCDIGQTVSAVKSDKWITPLLVNGTVVPFKIDTSAQANLINEKDIKTLKEKPKRLAKNTTPLKAYNGQPIETKGRSKLIVIVTDKQYSLLFVIIPSEHESLLEDKASEDLGLVKRVYHVNSANITMGKQSQGTNHTVLGICRHC